MQTHAHTHTHTHRKKGRNSDKNTHADRLDIHQHGRFIFKKIERAAS